MVSQNFDVALCSLVVCVRALPFLASRRGGMGNQSMAPTCSPGVMGLRKREAGGGARLARQRSKHDVLATRTYWLFSNGYPIAPPRLVKLGFLENNTNPH